VRFTNRITKRRNENGEKFINEYKVLRTLGKGSVGSVKLCEKRSPEYSTESNVVENEALTEQKDPNLEYFALKSYNKESLARVKKYGEDCGCTGILTKTCALTAIKQEIEILVSLDIHKNVCTLHEVLESRVCDKMYIVLDYLDGGCLMQCNIQTLIYTNPELGKKLKYSLDRKASG